MFLSCFGSEFVFLCMQRVVALLEEARDEAAAAQDVADSAQSALTSARQQLADSSEELACSEAKVRPLTCSLLHTSNSNPCSCQPASFLYLCMSLPPLNSFCQRLGPQRKSCCPLFASNIRTASAFDTGACTGDPNLKAAAKQCPNTVL